MAKKRFPNMVAAIKADAIGVLSQINSAHPDLMEAIQSLFDRSGAPLSRNDWLNYATMEDQLITRHGTRARNPNDHTVRR